MKKRLVISLILVSLLASFHNSLTLLAFKLNQDFIAQNLCVFKAVEDNACQGCCHLKKQLQEDHEQDKKMPGTGEKKWSIDLFASSLKPYQSFHPSKTLYYYFKGQPFPTVPLTVIFKPPKSLV